MSWADWWSNPREKLLCQAQAFYIHNQRAQYLDSDEADLFPEALAQCIAPQKGFGLACPWWWPSDDGGEDEPVLPPGSLLLNVRYYVFRNGGWNVVPWARGQTFVGSRTSFDSLLDPANYRGQPASAWANKHGVIARGTRVIIRQPMRRA